MPWEAVSGDQLSPEELAERQMSHLTVTVYLREARTGGGEVHISVPAGSVLRSRAEGGEPISDIVSDVMDIICQEIRTAFELTVTSADDFPRAG